MLLPGTGLASSNEASVQPQQLAAAQLLMMPLKNAYGRESISGVRTLHVRWSHREWWTPELQYVRDGIGKEAIYLPQGTPKEDATPAVSER